ncbi:MAG: phenylalanine--tRNA ligase beta subunit-related protein [Bacteroidota bacterium]|nr:phenylalanine--tRNA ligase beta subunit-related protein [Bacteroidota bacterium]
MEITITDRIHEVCPELVLAVITCEVKNSVTSPALWGEMETEIQQFSANHSLEDINKRPEIAATRRVYRMLGKDPNRYRPSAEALCRRIVRGIPIYQVNTLVDCINLVSIRSGYSIGGFDSDKIQGNIELGVGTSNDEFEAIGRGMMNVEGLPIYRDKIGGIGTPTSDNERTKISENTTHLLMIINGYDGKRNLLNAANYAIDLLGNYACLKQKKVTWIA